VRLSLGKKNRRSMVGEGREELRGIEAEQNLGVTGGGGGDGGAKQRLLKFLKQPDGQVDPRKEAFSLLGPVERKNKGKNGVSLSCL